MSVFRSDLELVLERQPPDLTEFSRDLPRQWIEEALASTRDAKVRRRRLPSGQVVWLVVAMALMRNRSITGVVDHLGLTIGEHAVARSAVPQARQRLGSEPLHWLFYRLSSEWSHPEALKDCFHGMPLYGMDGVTTKVSDTKENREAFGGPSNGSGACAHPIVRSVALLTLRARLLVGVSFGTYHQSEHIYAQQLWPQLPVGSMCVFDKGFYAAATACRLIEEGRHFLCRLPVNIACEVIKTIEKDDCLVRITLPDDVARANPQLPKSFVARRIRIRAPRTTRKDGGTGQKGAPAPRQYLLTSVQDAAIKAQEFRDLYGERWELENAYDEIKTETLEREETLRSKSPGMVEQELWGLFLAYNLVRLEMTRAAERAKVKPTRISFVFALNMIRDEMIFLANAAPGAIPRQLQNLRYEVSRMVLPPRRKRSYPRVVKAGRTRYPVKRPAKTKARRPTTPRLSDQH